MGGEDLEKQQCVGVGNHEGYLARKCLLEE